MRIDRFLWFARIVPARKVAQQLASDGHLRIRGHATVRPATAVRIGDILAFATRSGSIRTLRVEALPPRRGPAAEARACYTDLASGVDGAPVQS